MSKNNVVLLNNSPGMQECLDYDIKRIRTEISKVSECFFYIGARLYDIKKSGYFGIYKNLYDFAEREFDLKATATKNLIACYLKYKIPDRHCMSGLYKDYNYTQLVEMLPLDKGFIVENISPKMTVAEIRDLKRSINRVADVSEVEFPNVMLDKTGQLTDQNRNDLLPEAPTSILDTVGQMSDQSDSVIINLSREIFDKLDNMVYSSDYGLFAAHSQLVEKLILAEYERHCNR